MTQAALQRHSIPASECVVALRANQVDHVVTVPDWVQLSLHRELERGVDGVRLLNCTNENQAVTAAAGLRLGGRRPLVMMQNQGLYNCINTLRAVCLDARVPLVLMVGQFGREYANLGQPSTHSRRTMVRLMEPLLQTLDLPFLYMDRPGDTSAIEQAFRVCEERRTAAVLLVSAPLAWS